VTGAAGFICGYLVAELLHAGHEVVGVDNFSKYGPVRRTFDTDPRYRLVEGDAKDAELLTVLAVDCDHVVLPRVRLRPAGRERTNLRRHI